MERRDYIERQIEQFAQAVARILGLRVEDPARAVREADSILSQLTGFPLDMILRLGATGIVRTLGADRAHAIAPVLDASAQALRSAGRVRDADALEKVVGDLRAGPPIGAR